MSNDYSEDEIREAKEWLAKYVPGFDIEISSGSPQLVCTDFDLLAKQLREHQIQRAQSEVSAEQDNGRVATLSPQIATELSCTRLIQNLFQKV